jgi:hypothetical protein
MISRIGDLADRLWRVHPRDIDALGMKTRQEFYQHELKKFQEAIIRECAQVCEQYITHPDHREGRLRCAEDIKAYFGIEE